MMKFELFTPAITKDYNLRDFKKDLKVFFEVAAVQNKICILFIEDFQLIKPDFLEIINSMKGFLAAFWLQSITRDQVLGLFKPRSDSFCSMISRSEDMTVNISPMNGVLAAFGLQATSSLVCSGQAVLVR